MISVHLYGKLRRFARDATPTSASIAEVSHQDRDTVRSVVERLGIPRDDLGANVFLNGLYADLSTPVSDGDRLGLFPDDMQLLYKWYFSPNTSSDVGGPSRPGDSGAARAGSEAPNLDTEDPTSGSGKTHSSSETSSGALDSENEVEK